MRYGAAGFFSVLTGAWTIYVTQAILSESSNCLLDCPPYSFWHTTYPGILLILGFVLLADSVICFRGKWLAFRIGSTVSLIIFVSAFIYLSGPLGDPYMDGTAFNPPITGALSLLTMVLNVIAMRVRGRGVAEAKTPLGSSRLTLEFRRREERRCECPR